MSGARHLAGSPTASQMPLDFEIRRSLPFHGLARQGRPCLLDIGASTSPFPACFNVMAARTPLAALVRTVRRQ